MSHIFLDFVMSILDWNFSNFFLRYVDDIYLQTTGKEMANRFHHTMNSLHPKLKFEIEKPETTPSGLTLSLLDFKVTVSEDGRRSFEFYKKTSQETNVRTPPISHTQEIKDQLHSQ